MECHIGEAERRWPMDAFGWTSSIAWSLDRAESDGGSGTRTRTKEGKEVGCFLGNATCYCRTFWSRLVHLELRSVSRCRLFPGWKARVKSLDRASCGSLGMIAGHERSLGMGCLLAGSMGAAWPHLGDSEPRLVASAISRTLLACPVVIWRCPGQKW